jgi:hypothetical protein
MPNEDRASATLDKTRLLLAVAVNIAAEVNFTPIEAAEAITLTIYAYNS